MICDSGVAIGVQDMQGCWKAQWNGQEVLGRRGSSWEDEKSAERKEGNEEADNQDEDELRGRAPGACEYLYLCFSFLTADISQAQQFAGGGRGTAEALQSTFAVLFLELFLHLGHPGALRPTGQGKDNGHIHQSHAIGAHYTHPKTHENSAHAHKK